MSHLNETGGEPSDASNELRRRFQAYFRSLCNKYRVHPTSGELDKHLTPEERTTLRTMSDRLLYLENPPPREDFDVLEPGWDDEAGDVGVVDRLPEPITPVRQHNKSNNKSLDDLIPQSSMRDYTDRALDVYNQAKRETNPETQQRLMNQFHSMWQQRESVVTRTDRALVIVERLLR
jgi:hypothetical protein